jgi:phosphate transport system substrate-binding protein
MKISTSAALALWLPCALLYGQAQPRLLCAGGTFPDPIYQKWIASFNAQKPGLPVVFQAVGSEQAMKELENGEVDFAASDFPPPERTQGKLNVRLIPALAGAAVPVYNLSNAGTDLRFTPEVLAGIYLGEITNWDDPRIKALNRKAALPDHRIVVVHRSDGSGTSFLWTDFLASSSSEWKDKVGASPLPNWPVGIGKNGNAGVAEYVATTPFAIGYVEFIYALQRQLLYGSVKNPAGTFVPAGIDTITAAAASAVPDAGERISIVNAPGRDAYPICSFTWFLVRPSMNSGEKRERLTAFLDWALSSGQRQVAALGYVPLPEQVAARARRALANLWQR